MLIYFVSRSCKETNYSALHDRSQYIVLDTPSLHRYKIAMTVTHYLLINPCNIA